MNVVIVAILVNGLLVALLAGPKLWARWRSRHGARGAGDRSGIRHAHTRRGETRTDRWSGAVDGIAVEALLRVRTSGARGPRASLRIDVRLCEPSRVSEEAVRRVAGALGAEWDFVREERGALVRDDLQGGGWTFARDEHGSGERAPDARQASERIAEGLALVRMQRAAAAMSPALIAALASPETFAERRGSPEWNEAVAIAEGPGEDALRRRFALLVGYGHS